ncbi:lipoprotein [Aeromonas encheleia]|uniref:Lipoprotein n=1 Tax=Aeromonas encheleia TaxID=73010 RepID=A0AAE9ME98_9GAMM|nr:hypothetical protein [Aeromonas encheleia]MBV7415988.1 hypothetical protein [Aeromonas sp. sif2433]MBV7438173.1 hypothetical protein [Aeromonas sp. sif2416]MBV7597379.1 hypothetical protein [Aeromonas sp. sia0103]UNP89174.1 hypothetical protein MNZ22_01390 [Aeromonas encheleia]USV56884.1 hypothetical protein NHF51_16275 [Aeromonas encheleia]
MRLLSAVALVLLLPAITACSGLPGVAPDGPAPLFRTHINEEGSKRFTFEAAPFEELPSRLQDDDSRLSRNSKSLLERREALQDEQLTETLAERKYCHSGYIVLSQTSWKIRGECNETATQADRLGFPNLASWQD